MFGLGEASAFWTVVAINAVGIISLIVARLRGNTTSQIWFHVLFFAALAVVGAALMVAVVAGSGVWISLAITVAIMVIGATLDTGYSRAANRPLATVRSVTSRPALPTARRSRPARRAN